MNEDEEKNIYLAALQFGYENISSGITKKELFDCLVSKGFDLRVKVGQKGKEKWGELAEERVVNSVVALPESDGRIQGKMRLAFREIVQEWFTPPVDEKSFLNIHAVQFYIDLIELREAREQARKAEQHANRALWFAFAGLFLGFIGAVTPFILPYFNFTQPQKVEIINKQLEPIYPITPFVSPTAQKLQQYPHPPLL